MLAPLSPTAWLCEWASPGCARPAGPLETLPWQSPSCRAGSACSVLVRVYGRPEVKGSCSGRGAGGPGSQGAQPRHPLQAGNAHVACDPLSSRRPALFFGDAPKPGGHASLGPLPMPAPSFPASFQAVGRQSSGPASGWTSEKLQPCSPWGVTADAPSRLQPGPSGRRGPCYRWGFALSYLKARPAPSLLTSRAHRGQVPVAHCEPRGPVSRAQASSFLAEPGGGHPGW